MVPPVYNLMQFGRWPTAIFHPALQVLITAFYRLLLLPFAGFIIRQRSGQLALVDANRRSHCSDIIE